MDKNKHNKSSSKLPPSKSTGRVHNKYDDDEGERGWNNELPVQEKMNE